MKNTITIAQRRIGRGNPVFLIAEIGVNHNGNVRLACEMIDAAKKAGADCVKFQTFKADRVVTASAPKASYQLKTTPKTESQIEMLRKLELSDGDYREILAHCKRREAMFFSTPYNYEDVDFLESLNVPAYKIASGQIIELPFLRHVARLQKPILLSTGMATLAEVDLAVRAILDTGNDRLILLQCTTNYPSLLEDANILAMNTMERCFQLPVGYSDHTQGYTACIAAVALGACVIEKHFTLDRSLPGPDHSSSSTPSEFAALVHEVRNVEKALGSGIKQPSQVELENAKGMRRSIVMSRLVKDGQTITSDVLTFKRPSTGINPSMVDLVIGRKARRDLEPGEMIDWDDLRR